MENVELRIGNGEEGTGNREHGEEKSQSAILHSTFSILNSFPPHLRGPVAACRSGMEPCQSDATWIWRVERDRLRGNAADGLWNHAAVTPNDHCLTTSDQRLATND